MNRFIQGGLAYRTGCRLPSTRVHTPGTALHQYFTPQIVRGSLQASQNDANDDTALAQSGNPTPMARPRFTVSALWGATQGRGRTQAMKLPVKFCYNSNWCWFPSRVCTGQALGVTGPEPLKLGHQCSVEFMTTTTLPTQRVFRISSKLIGNSHDD